MSLDVEPVVWPDQTMTKLPAASMETAGVAQVVEAVVLTWNSPPICTPDDLYIWPTMLVCPLMSLDQTTT